MALQTRNIIIGAARVFLSVKNSTDATWSGGPALPAGLSTKNGTSAVTTISADSTAWQDAGFTSEGIEVAYEPDFGEVEVDQLLDSARLFKQSQKVSVNTTFAEADLENLLVAWALPSAASTGESVYAENTGTVGGVAVGSGDQAVGLFAGSLGDEPVERAIVFVGPSPKTAAGAKRERIYHVRRVLSVESSSHSLKRNEPTSFPVSFRALPDPNLTGAEYGLIWDRKVS